MASISKSERLLNLVSFLLKSRRPVAPAEIWESVEGYRATDITRASLERRFERDKAALRKLGVPLEYVPQDEPGGPGYVIPKDVYFLPRIELTAAEAAILSAAGRFALAGAAGPISDPLRSAVRKLQFDTPIPGGIRGTVEESFVFHRRDERSGMVEQAALSELTSDVLARRVVRFQYYAIGHDELAQRTVEPYGLGYADGHWYLVGYDRDRKDIRVFRADRIRSRVRKLHRVAAGPEFDVPGDFRVRDHVGLPPWAFGKAERVKVRMRFDADSAFMVRMRPSPGDEWEDHPDGSATLTRCATHLDSLLNWVLGFGHHVEVTAPRGFRERVIDTLRMLADAHRGKAMKEGARG